jgi:predicted O-methyltransferase YrrM
MKHSYFKIPGWFNYSETYDTIVDEISDDAKILEIGSFMGRSTHYLATALHNADKQTVKIYALDTFEGSSEHANLKMPKDFFSTFKENLKFFIGRDVVIPMQGRSDSKEIIEKFEDRFFDYIMVDGAHEYEAVMDDIENWWPKLKENGVMFGDDFYLDSVAQAVKTTSESLKSPGYSVNGSTERTWFTSKDGKHNRFERLIPGQNILI